jgi:hypothetical protein
MSVTHITALRNVLADAVDNYINTTGGGTAQVLIRESTTNLVAFDLANPAFGAASGGTVTLNSVPIAATASADGVADNARITDRAGAKAVDCSVTGSGGGGDIEASNTSISNGQDCELVSLTYSAPA